MATSSQIFKAIIRADADGAVTDLRKFGGEVEQVTRGSVGKTDAVGAAFTRVGRVAASLGVADVLRSSVLAASDLEESINAVKVTFDDAAGGVLALADNSATSVGLAKSEFNGLAVSFAGFATQIAGPGGDVVGVIDDLTTRSADFASVMNLDVTEAAQIFSSTLAGESEPIKRFGITIDEARVNAKALEMGLADTTTEVDASDKVLARYAILMEETSKTAGDFANTSDSLANQMRVAKAQFTDASAALGAELLPMAASATGALSDIVGALGNMPGAARQFTVAAGLVAVGLGTIGTKATATLGLLGLVSGAVNAVSSGVQGDMSFLEKDVSIFEKPFQMAGQFGYAMGNGEWGSWEDQIALLDRSEQAAQGFNMALLDGVTSGDQANAIIREYTSTLGDNVDQTHAANYLMALWGQTTESAAKETAIASEMQRDQARAANHTATVLGELRRTQEEAAAATERHRQSIRDLFDEVYNNLGTMFDYESSLIDLESASTDLATRTAEVEAAFAAGDLTAEEYDAELRRLREAEIGTAEQALQTAGAYAESKGAIEGTTEYAILQREELGRLADEFPGVRDEIGLFVAELEKIPAVKTVSLVIERNAVNEQFAADGINVRVDEFGNLIQRANGGPVTANVPYMVGERGPELFVPSTSGSIVPNNRVGGGSTFNITVNAGMGADGGRIGQTLVDAIKTYERRNGNRWRNP